MKYIVQKIKFLNQKIFNISNSKKFYLLSFLNFPKKVDFQNFKIDSAHLLHFSVLHSLQLTLDTPGIGPKSAQNPLGPPTLCTPVPPGNVKLTILCKFKFN